MLKNVLLLFFNNHLIRVCFQLILNITDPLKNVEVFGPRMRLEQKKLEQHYKEKNLLSHDL